MTRFQSLREYLGQATGSPVLLRPAKRIEGSLPSYLAHSYSLGRGELFGREMAIALATSAKDNPPTFQRLQADYQALRQACGDRPVALAFEHLPSYLRSHLVGARIPFVVIGRQIFLPHYWVDLRDREEAPPEPPQPFLTWSSQVVLLRHLLWHDVESLSLSGLAEKLNYSAMAMTFVHRQLEAEELAMTQRKGHSKYLSFAEEGRALWELALPKLRKPWSRRIPVQGSDFPAAHKVWHSGLSALAKRTAINADGTKVRATFGDHLREAEKEHELSVAEHMEFAQIQLEVWEYDPGVLAEGSCVDPLSLFLCLQEDPNERIQGALEDLLDEVEW